MLTFWYSLQCFYELFLAVINITGLLWQLRKGYREITFTSVLYGKVLDMGYFPSLISKRPWQLCIGNEFIITRWEENGFRIKLFLDESCIWYRRINPGSGAGGHCSQRKCLWDPARSEARNKELPYVVLDRKAELFCSRNALLALTLQLPSPWRHSPGFPCSQEGASVPCPPYANSLNAAPTLLPLLSACSCSPPWNTSDWNLRELNRTPINMGDMWSLHLCPPWLDHYGS